MLFLLTFLLIRRFFYNERGENFFEVLQVVDTYSKTREAWIGKVRRKGPLFSFILRYYFWQNWCHILWRGFSRIIFRLLFLLLFSYTPIFVAFRCSLTSFVACNRTLRRLFAFFIVLSTLVAFCRALSRLVWIISPRGRLTLHSREPTFDVLSVPLSKLLVLLTSFFHRNLSDLIVVFLNVLKDLFLPCHLFNVILFALLYNCCQGVVFLINTNQHSSKFSFHELIVWNTPSLN